jgi:FAD-linked sulfhydryl oxidase
VHPPSRAYIDPWSGQLFGEGGVEKTLHPEDALKSHLGSNVKGKVIMSKLGNETAK